MRICLVSLLILFSAGCSSTQVRFAAIGDTPYYESEYDLSVVSDVLDNMHEEGIPFVVHIGDIIRGGTSCSEELFMYRADVFSNSPIPFLITIGDNEFNDCKNPLKARRQFRNIILNNPPVKHTIYGTDKSIDPVHVTRQPGMIENAAWRYNDVDFIMLTLPDFPGYYRLKPAMIKEIVNFNIEFLTDNFNKAKDNNSHAVVVIMHASPITCSSNACERFIKIFKEEIASFNNPVLLLNGSVHEPIFEGPGYMEIPNLWHLRPGSEPDESWPDIIFSKQSNIFSVKFHIAITNE